MKDARLKRANINAAATLVHQLVSTLCGLVIPWLMINYFGSVKYGITVSIAQFLSYITLFEGGIGRVARGALYKPLAQKNDIEISKVYLAVKRFFRAIGIAFLAYSLILAIAYRYIADITELSFIYIFAMVIFISIGKFAEYMGGITNITLFNADQKQYIVYGAIVVSNILNALLVVILVHFGCDILWVKLGSSLVFVLKPVFYSIYLKKHYNIIKVKEKTELKNKWIGLGQHMAYFIHNNTDIMILTVLADVRFVAVYSVYYLVVSSIRNITSAFTGGMEALFGDMYAKKEYDALYSAYRRYKMLLTVLSVTLFGVTALLILPFVKLYTARAGDSAEYSQPLFAVIMILAEAMSCIGWPCFNLPIAANKLKESRYGAYGEAVINIITSVILVILLENPLLGVAIGTLVSSVFKNLYYIFFSGKYILKGKTGVMIRDFLLSVLLLTAISVGGMIAEKQITIQNYLIWALYGVVAVILVGMIGVAFGAILYPDKIKGLKKAIIRK